MVQRPRIFSHADNYNSKNDSQVRRRAPLGTASDAEMNSVQTKEPVVKRIINRQRFHFINKQQQQYRSVSSPVGGTSGENNEGEEEEEEDNAPRQLKVACQPTIIPLNSSTEPKEDTRSVCLHAVPSSIGLASILAQTSGGPLERVETRYETSYPPRQFYSVELFYMNTCHAKQFYQFATSGRLLVNGRVFKPVRGTATLSNQSAKSRQHVQEMVNKKARRCVVLVRTAKPPAGLMYGDKAMARHRCQLPAFNPVLDVNLDQIKEHFSKLGVVITVQPILATALSISVQYADVKSAIRAKHLFDRKQDEFYKQYRGWSLAYGKDPVDRPCPVDL